MDGLAFPDVVASCSPEALVLCSQIPLVIFSSAIASTGRRMMLPYAGPVTHVGWLIGRCVRTAPAAA